MRDTGEPAVVRQTMPSSRKLAIAAASRPSQSASTSAVCSPSNGADSTSLGTPSKRTGQAGIVILRFAVRHRLEDAALPEAGFVDQFLRIEDGARGDADRAQLCHRLVLRALAGPGRDDLVDLGLAFHAGIGSLVARIADEVLAPDKFQQARPMLGIGTAGRQVNVIVGAAGLAWVDATGRVIGGRTPRRRLAGARPGDEPATAVMHDRILHRYLQPSALPGARPIDHRAGDAECHRNAGAGCAG